MPWFRHRTRAEHERAAEDVRRAEDALEELAEAKERAAERTSEISEIARTLRAASRRNHFGLLIRDALRGDFR